MWAGKLGGGLLALLALAPVSGRADPPAVPLGPTARSQPAGYQLKREEGHGWVYDGGAFVARIAEDGTVRFDDKRVSIGLALPVPLPLPPGTPTVEGSLRKLVNPRAQRRREVESAPMPDRDPFHPQTAEWCTYPHPCHFQARVLLINVRGTADVTDEVMRIGRQDPYRSQKASFLSSTAAFRQDLAGRAAARARQQALEAVRARLVELERDPKLAPAQRRAAMEAMIADLDPDPAVAAPARALIEARLRAQPR
jgi:hypothetical protein